MYELIDETTEFVVIYKKPGTSFHSDSGELGLFEFCKQALGLNELYPVHRLDKITSGVLLMAKTAAANQQLTLAFCNREIEKYYLAISAKKPTKKQGLVKGDMAPARRGAFKLLATTSNPAITQFFSQHIAPGRRLFIVKPHTGKTHQIRVALKSIGAPILGDSLYADKRESSEVDRVYLHAYSIAFRLNNQDYRYTALPREGEFFCEPNFTEALQGWQQPWLLNWPRVAA